MKTEKEGETTCLKVLTQQQGFVLYNFDYLLKAKAQMEIL